MLGCVGSIGLLGLAGMFMVVVLGAFGAGATYWYFSRDLPTVADLRNYEPPTVTTLVDVNGEVMGEIYEQRRYVVPMEEIPEHVKQAFLAAEDANFYAHGGVDYMGMVRAFGRNAVKGRMAQGASTITQQVARNFLLTRDKTIVRKIKEIILSWRIEDAYEKDHILYLYLNEIFLGSQSYGVEAASRTFYGKHVTELTVAEAAILAGLPPAPSAYNPYKDWAKAKTRQGYVLDQMLTKSFITEAERDAALAEELDIKPRGNAFLEQAPYFTEHVRRYLVDKYGEEVVLNGGLTVKTTCDMGLQVEAQKAAHDGVFDVDQKFGFRRPGVENVGGDGIDAKRAEHEEKYVKQWISRFDPAKRNDPPPTSILEAGEVYEAVLTSVKKGYALAGIGKHDAVIPLAWSRWVYEPNTRKSWHKRKAYDLTVAVDGDGDGRRDGPILRVGDVVLVKVEALSTREKAVRSAFASTPGAKKGYVAARLWQEPEVEAALMSMDTATGAVRVMVGGSSFERSQFNRAIQGRRQVGSTFKPLVYAAAIQSKRLTAATLFSDAPITFQTKEGIPWKPQNFSDNYEGHLTLRQGLAKSKNTITIRVLEAADPGMNGDVIYNFGRALGIGGPPTHLLPEGWVPTPDNDLLCPWVRETPKSTICMDRYPAIDPNLSDAKHRSRLGPNDEYWCRACDMSMGLGSASLTMEEMIRAYSAFPAGGTLIEPYYIEEVRDRDGNLLEQHVPTDFKRVMDPAVASIGTWLLQGVVQYGTGVKARKELGLVGLAGKTGTTNDYKDAWFVGFTNDVITAAWVGYDKPRSMGYGSTGGKVALPIWTNYMRAATKGRKDRPFPIRGDVAWAGIDETTGTRLEEGGVSYPFLPGTMPESTGLKEGEVSVDELGSL